MTAESMTLFEGYHIPKNPLLSRYLGNSDAADLYQQIYYWEENPACSGFVDSQGVKWIYNTLKQWALQLGITERAARTAFKTLKDHNLLHTAQPKKCFWDRTLHCRIDREAREALKIELEQLRFQVESELEALMAKNRLKANKTGNVENDISKSQNSLIEDHDLPLQKQRLLTKTSPNSKQNNLPADAFFEDCAKEDPGQSDFEDSKPTEPGQVPGVLANALSSDKSDLPRAHVEIVEKLVALDIKPNKAHELIENYTPEVIIRQLEWLPYRKVSKSQAAMLVAALKGNYAMPPEFENAAQQPDQQEKSKLKQEISDFVSKLQPFATHFKSPINDLYQFIRVVNDGMLWVKRPTGEESAMKIDLAMKWGMTA